MNHLAASRRGIPYSKRKMKGALKNEEIELKQNKIVSSLLNIIGGVQS